MSERQGKEAVEIMKVLIDYIQNLRDARDNFREGVLEKNKALIIYKRFHDKVGCPGLPECAVCQLEREQVITEIFEDEV